MFFLMKQTFTSENWVYKYKITTEKGVYYEDFYTEFPATSSFAGCIEWGSDAPYQAGSSIPYCGKYLIETGSYNALKGND
jgi:hypothetical protein